MMLGETEDKSDNMVPNPRCSQKPSSLLIVDGASRMVPSLYILIPSRINGSAMSPLSLLPYVSGCYQKQIF